MGTDYQLMCKTCYDKYENVIHEQTEEADKCFDLVYFYFDDVHVIEDEIINDKPVNIIDLTTWLSKHTGHKIYFGC